MNIDLTKFQKKYYDNSKLKRISKLKTFFSNNYSIRYYDGGEIKFSMHHENGLKWFTCFLSSYNELNEYIKACNRVVSVFDICVTSKLTQGVYLQDTQTIESEELTIRSINIIDERPSYSVYIFEGEVHDELGCVRIKKSFENETGKSFKGDAYFFDFTYDIESLAFEEVKVYNTLGEDVKNYTNWNSFINDYPYFKNSYYQAGLPVIPVEFLLPSGSGIEELFKPYT